MSRPSRQKRIHTLTEKALQGYARVRAEVRRRQGQAPRSGDLFVFDETAGLPVEWLVLGPDPQHPECLLAVAADLHPLVGSADVAVPAGAVSGPLSIRCACAVRVTVERCAAARRTGFLEPEHLERIGCKRAELETDTGALAGSILAAATDGEPEYRDWVEEVLEKAQSTLLETLLRETMRRETSPPVKAGKADHSRRGLVGGSFSAALRLAASILLATTLGFLAGAVWQLRQEEISEPLVNLPVALLGPAGTVRGQVHTLIVPPTASHFLVLLELNTRYPAYRLEARKNGSDTPVWADDLTRVGKTELNAVLPSRLFAAGEYRLHLYGLDGLADLLAEYVLRIDDE